MDISSLTISAYLESTQLKKYQKVCGMFCQTLDEFRFILSLLSKFNNSNADEIRKNVNNIH